ncbi:MAG: hypothetical protein HQL52_13730 [Magnetococcales bacterium]|nr:hypothetical protein [Magnetococcales bacterium]
MLEKLKPWEKTPPGRDEIKSRSKEKTKEEPWGQAPTLPGGCKTKSRSKDKKNQDQRKNLGEEESSPTPLLFFFNSLNPYSPRSVVASGC